MPKAPVNTNVKTMAEVRRALAILAGLDLYSTNEVPTRKVWIDGKQIYRKVVDFGALPNIATKQVAHGISNLDTFVAISAWALKAGVVIPLPRAHNTDSFNVGFLVDATNITIQTWATGWNSYNAHVTLEYTKT